MTIEDYKKAIAADPWSTVDVDSEDAAARESCAEFQQEMQALDKQIADALAIKVPEMRMPDLPPLEATEDEATDNVVSLKPKQKPSFSMPSWIGMAAALALAAIVTFQYLPDNNISDDDLVVQILEHMDHEPWAMEVTNVSVTEDRLDQVFDESGGTMEGELGLVTYAESCIINGRRIPHLVIQGENGPVTMLMLPEEQVSSPVPIDGEGIQGVILPFGGDGEGSIALIGERDFDAERLKNRVVNSVEWSI